MTIDNTFDGGESGAQSMLNAIQDREKQYTEEELFTNLDWIEASHKLYEMNEGKKFEGDHIAVAQYGLDQMSQFNYNMTMGMIPDVMAVEGADNETQIAFAYLMDTYDKKDITLNGVGRAIKEIGLDPSTYLGLGTLGAGFAVKKGAQNLAKEGIKNRLHNSIRNYLTNGLAVGATEGALYTAGDEVARESVYQDAGVMDEYSPENIATAGVLGAVAGAGLVKGAEVLGSQLGKGIDYLNKQGEEAMAVSAGGGTPGRESGEFFANGFNYNTAKRVKVGNNFPDRIQFYNPVKLTSGDRISGFSEIGQDTLYGYDKNGEIFTINPKDLANNYEIDKTAKSKNQPAQETADKLEEFLSKFKKETK